MNPLRPSRRSPAKPTRRILPAIALGLLALIPTGCRREAGPFPSREVKLIVQASPGGISDTVSRFMASLAEKDLGVPLVCENKPGASGALAFSYVSRRPADGYTVGHAAVEIAMVRSLGYADIGPENLSLICLVSKTAPALVVQSGSPWRTLDEFLADARRRPGELIMANSGTGSIWHFNTLLMEQQAQVRVTHVPYPGTSAALVALLGGHVDGAIGGVGEVVTNVNSGHLRALAVLDQSRSGVLPEVPASYELGYPFGTPAWSGFFGPQGLPDEVRRKLERAFHDAFETADWKKLCEDRGMEAVFLDGPQFQQFALQQARFFSAEIPKLLRMER